jgi:hypothetical protein
MPSKSRFRRKLTRFSVRLGFVGNHGSPGQPYFAFAALTLAHLALAAAAIFARPAADILRLFRWNP